MSPGLLEEIEGWSAQKRQNEIEYMANTVPSSWEFCDYSFMITGVTRAFTHQLVRTRTASYAQQAMRVLTEEEQKDLQTNADEIEGELTNTGAGAAIARPVAGGPSAVEMPGAVQRVKAPPSGPGKAQPKMGRNDVCFCGSGKKFKHCHYPNLPA